MQILLLFLIILDLILQILNLTFVALLVFLSVALLWLTLLFQPIILFLCNIKRFQNSLKFTLLKLILSTHLLDFNFHVLVFICLIVELALYLIVKCL